ncbi:MAG: hypothetical protein LBP39_01470 [Rickettsiales bacterium]|nr:hypothetical protein [Rickettsiales bacterium]
MKISKKVNYNRIAGSYLFLGMLTIFIGLGVGTCLASSIHVDNSSELEKAIGCNNVSTINIGANPITLDRELLVISRDLTISGEANGKSTLDGNNIQRILEFNTVVDNITVNNIHFQHGHNKNPLDYYNGGGALHIRDTVLTALDNRRTTVTLNNVNFSSNTAVSCGGAVYSVVSTWDKNTFVVFNGKTTFASNESTNGGGGAIYANLSYLTFSGETKFEKNKSEGNGGAIYSNLSNLTFSGETKFEKNKSNKFGGAIYAQSSRMTFGGKTTFEENKSEENGGAVHAKCSVLTFGGEAKFKNNKSRNSGGAIYAWYSDLVFSEDVEFDNNSSFSNGGAISAINYHKENVVNLTFNKPVLFTNNSSARGGAIYLGGSINLTFNSGLRLILNTTGEEKSGTIHMEGEDRGRRARVNIVQRDPRKLTTFIGNRSNKGRGHNAFYLQQYAELNFTAENGNIELHDAIVGGERDRDTNAATVDVVINKGAGWFNVREGGSIANVNLTNRGILNIFWPQDTVRPLDFRNSGNIIFGIFPENNKCGRIQAEDITLEEGTTLEVIASPGVYKVGDSYDIIVSKNTIRKPENINVTLHQGLKAKVKLIDNRIYRLLIGEDNDDNNNNDEN